MERVNARMDCVTQQTLLCQVYTLDKHMHKIVKIAVADCRAKADIIENKVPQLVYRDYEDSTDALLLLD